MSAIVLLMGLLLLSYVGSFIIGGRTARGLPSGVEFLGLGFAVGPHALGLVERSMLGEFEPIMQVALGWLAFVVGLDFGRVAGRRVRGKQMALGVFCALLTGVTVAVTVNRLLAVWPVPGVDQTGGVLLAAGAGAVTAETTRFVVQWVASERRGQSTMPVAFWWLSLAGGAILLCYAIARHDVVISAGQAAGLVVYARNLVLLRRRADRAP